MGNRYGEAVDRHASVTVEAAARLVDVDVATIRHWSHVRGLVIERRGDMEVVRLDQVRALTTGSTHGGEHAGTGNGALRALLRDAAMVDPLNISGLQQMVREKSGEPA